MESEFTQHYCMPIWQLRNISECISVITKIPTKSTLFFFGKFYNFACGRPVYINQRFQNLWSKKKQPKFVLISDHNNFDTFAKRYEHKVHPHTLIHILPKSGLPTSNSQVCCKERIWDTGEWQHCVSCLSLCMSVLVKDGCDSPPHLN